MCHLIGWHEFGVKLIYMKCLRYMLSHFLSVAGEHDRAFDAQLLEFVDAFNAIVLDMVVDDDVACILSVDSHMDDSADMMAWMPLCTYGFHHALIAHTDDVVLNLCANALSCHFFHMADAASVGSLFGERITQGSSDGMGGKMLYVGSEVKQLTLVEMVGMHRFYGKLTVGEGARLIENHRMEVGECIHIACPFHQYAVARCSTDASKEGEGNADDESARARYH